MKAYGGVEVAHVVVIQVNFHEDILLTNIILYGNCNKRTGIFLVFYVTSSAKSR
jgi:hypothetical protein